MTAKEILNKIKAKHRIGKAWQLTEHIIIEAMEEYAKEPLELCNTIPEKGKQLCQHSDKIYPETCIYDCTDCPYT